MNNPYEDAKLLGEYLLFHYGADQDVMPWDFGPRSGLHFPRRTVEELIDHQKLLAAGGLFVDDFTMLN